MIGPPVAAREHRFRGDHHAYPAAMVVRGEKKVMTNVVIFCRPRETFDPSETRTRAAMKNNGTKGRRWAEQRPTMTEQRPVTR